MLFRSLQPLAERLPTVLAPKTIDNDLGLNYPSEPDEFVRVNDAEIKSGYRYKRTESRAVFDLGPAGVNAVVELKVGDKTHATVVKELQRHRVRRNVTHVDFQVVNMDEEITVDVPIVLVGEAKAVLAEGGMVDAAVDTLPIVTTPRHIPNEITIEISEMQPGDVIRVADITLPAGTSTSADPDTPVVTVLISRAAIETAAEGEAGEGEAEGAAGESAGGDSAGGGASE